MPKPPTHKVKVRVLKGKSAEEWILDERINTALSFPKRRVDGIIPKLKTQENPDYTKGLEGFY